MKTNELDEMFNAVYQSITYEEMSWTTKANKHVSMERLIFLVALKMKELENENKSQLYYDGIPVKRIS